MKKDRSGLRFGFATLFLAAIYSILLFALKKDFDTASWLLYGFTLLAFLILMLDVYIPGNKAMRYPMLDRYVSAAATGYFAIQFVLGGVIAMFFGGLDATLVLIVETLLFVGYLARTFVFALAKQIIAGQDKHDGQKVAAIRMLRIELDTIAAEAGEESLRASIAALAEAVGNSDPMSAEALHELEERIKSNVALLREEVDEGDAEKAENRVAKLRRLLDERNAKCAAMK